MRLLVAGLVLLVGGAVVHHHHTGTPPVAADHGNLSRHDFDEAVQVARDEARQQHAHLTSATAYVKVNQNLHSPTNTGHPCTSAKVLRITLYGSFPHIAVSPPPGVTDVTVTSMGLKVDEATGQPCLIGVGTGTPAPPPAGVVQLFS